MLKNLVRKHPALAELGWLPPVYLIGLIATWRDPAYTSGIPLLLMEINVNASFWWPTHMHLRQRAMRAR